jgi:hypothetical protein
MKRVFCILLGITLLTSLVFAADATTKTFGKTPTITEATPVAKLIGQPQKFVDQNVLVAGTVVDMCRHKGCWVEIMNPDSSRIICKSLDESVVFSKDCLGQQIALQGKVIFDSKAKGTMEAKKEAADAPAHACPAPKVLVSIEGANVSFADAKIEAKDQPKTDVKEQPKAETKEEAKPETKETGK